MDESSNIKIKDVTNTLENKNINNALFTCVKELKKDKNNLKILEKLRILINKNLTDFERGSSNNIQGGYILY